MLKKIFHGFLFGIGFSIAVIISFSLMNSYQQSSYTEMTLPEKKKAVEMGEKIKWQETSVSEKMDKLSAIALIRFTEHEGNFMEAHVEQIILKNEDVNIPLNIGDRFEKSDYYAAAAPMSNRNGILLMYANSPPREMEGAYLYDDRLVAYGDMPLDVFIDKFKTANGI